MENGFGLFFLYVFSTQVFSIFSLYLSVSQSIGSTLSGLKTFIVSTSYLLISCAFLLNIAALTVILDTGHKSLKDLTVPLQDKLLYLQEGFEKQSYINIIKDIEKTGPLNGKGFFNITRGTLTGMLSVGITYIIILVQFKMAD